ncbi:carbohydrate ABC transporter substrate-binding protein, CUT1 family [Halomicrobium zhouii]|uniref:Carbohydrate ABC transporter substrate-binding protein, CUT1 family n=1 Tax=Halomicrobium zhouii TaxID=767519 RepID=A0A1I6KZ51_9EURY|nr:extracellular solute-binding protein [Halomicrobium zhouii]SFR96491.1 carbohydrate ABC transporter substrate-binding protein, CUT1 family [Halomicrobium zhouii]
MDRRTVLKQLGAATAFGSLAGCVGVQEQDTETATNDDGGDGSDDGSADQDTETAGPAGEATAWYSLPEPELPGREKAIETFTSETRHTVEGSDISDLEQKTTSAVPAGQGPQVFDWAHDWVGDYYQRGFLTDQSDDLTVDLDVFTDAAADAVQYEGNVVGLPYSAETVTLVYNTDVVDEAPESVSDMVAVMDEYHDPDAGQYGLSYPFDPYFTSAFLQGFGGYYFDPAADPQLGVDRDETIQGLEFALENLTPYMPNDPTYEPQAAAFAEGNAAFAINGPWYLATLNDKGVNYEVTSLPAVDGGELRPYTGISMWYFAKAMESGGADATAGREFVEWYATNEEIHLQNAEEHGAIPVLDSLVGSDDLPANVQAYSETVGQGIPMPTDPKMNKVWGPMETALIDAFNGDATAEEALTTAATDIRENWE